jgi:hypothetical protein
MLKSSMVDAHADLPATFQPRNCMQLLCHRFAKWRFVSRAFNCTTRVTQTDMDTYSGQLHYTSTERTAPGIDAFFFSDDGRPWCPACYPRYLFHADFRSHPPWIPHICCGSIRSSKHSLLADTFFPPVPGRRQFVKSLCTSTKPLFSIFTCVSR